MLRRSFTSRFSLLPRSWQAKAFWGFWDDRQPRVALTLRLAKWSNEFSIWAVSSAGRARRSQRRGRGFEPLTVHYCLRLVLRLTTQCTSLCAFVNDLGTQSYPLKSHG